MCHLCTNFLDLWEWSESNFIPSSYPPLSSLLTTYLHKIHFTLFISFSVFQIATFQKKFCTIIIYVYLLSHIWATCSSHHNLNFITVSILGAHFIYLWIIHIQWNPYLRSHLGVVDLNTKLRKILNGSNLTLSLTLNYVNWTLKGGCTVFSWSASFQALVIKAPGKIFRPRRNEVGKLGSVWKNTLLLLQTVTDHGTERRMKSLLSVEYVCNLPVLLYDFRKSWNPSGAHKMLIGCWNMTLLYRKIGTCYREGSWR
jgi:hypothetical protein